MALHTWKTEKFHHDHHTNRPGTAVNALLPASETIAKRLIARHETIATAEYTKLARAALLGIGDAEMQGLRSATETYALLLARRVRDRHAAVWGVGETGATGPTGNRHGDPAGHTCIAIAGPTERAITLRTGNPGRCQNMEAFATRALELLGEIIPSV